MRRIVEAARALIRTSLDGDLGEAADLCESLAERCQQDGLTHFEGVSWLNAALCSRQLGDLDRSLACARRAIDALSSGSGGPELASARFAEATALALRGQLGEARQRFVQLSRELDGPSRSEGLTEWAEVEVLVGEIEQTRNILRELHDQDVGGIEALVGFVDAVRTLREGFVSDSVRAFRELDVTDLNPNPAYRSQVLAMTSVALGLLGDEEAATSCAAARAAAVRQHARPWQTVAELAAASVAGHLSSAIVTVPQELRHSISFAAEIVAGELDTLHEEAGVVVKECAHRSPERWRTALRKIILSEGRAGLDAARLLDLIGEAADVQLLRRIARQPRRTGADRQLGRMLARRLAPRASIHDLGRVSIEVGPHQSARRPIRRKVLALLCFLLTRPRWSATREEVMDAMWPEIDPAAAINSLNQTVYFLRREFEADYSEDTSPGYIQQDSDVLWLDPELISADSQDCVVLIARYEREPSADVAVALATLYAGRFALDFSYDEWCSDYREWLHVAYLHVIETQVKTDIDTGNTQRGIHIARQALEIEPRNDELELSMLQLLRRAGAHSAAAEQYSRYANMLRTDLGVEPPPFERLSDR
jgi:DNA-binding SARP family transcriptional activator